MAQQVVIAMFPSPFYIIAPTPMTRGVDGAVWFVDADIGRISPAGQVTQFRTNTWDVISLTGGPDGAMWFVEAIPFGAPGGPQIDRMTTSGTITQFPLPNPISYPMCITAGPDGALWFTDRGTNMIGRITTEGAVTEFPVPTPNAGLSTIKSGADHALWFAEGGAIGRMTTSGVVSEFPLPAISDIGAMTEGPDGAMWFTVQAGLSGDDAIGRISASGTITEYPVTYNSRPYGITAGPDGALWFTDSNMVGRITTAGEVSYYPAAAGGIGSDYTGQLWLTGDIGNGGVYTPGVIEQIVFPTATLAVTPGNAFVGTQLSFTGSGFAPNEVVRIYTNAIGSAVLATATADGTGAISVTAAVPATPYLFGTARMFLAVGQGSGKVGAASFSVKARLNLNPSTGAAGSTVKVSGSGFGPSETMRIFWDKPNTLLGTITADLYGSFGGSSALQITIPSNATPGTYRISGDNLYGGANGGATFTVQ